MGWTWTNRKRGISNAEFFESEFGNKFKIVASNSTLTEFYGAVENVETGGRFGIVVLMRRDSSPYAYHNFGYKDMDETMGPGCYKASREVLEALEGHEPSNEYAADWRKACWEYIEFRESQPKVSRGDMVVFDKSFEFSNGWRGDTFFFEKGSTFRMRGAGRVRITSWRDRRYSVVRKPS